MKVECCVLSWHPKGSQFYTSGGVKRFAEIAKRTPKPIVIIDNHPSIFKSLRNSKVQILEYGKFPNLEFLTKIHPVIYDLIQRIFAVLQILTAIFALPSKPRVIYVPFSEHVHLTLAAIVCKILFGSRVVLCNLNVNIFFGEKPINVFLHRFADDIITISNSLKNKLEKTGIRPKHVNGVGFEKPKIEKKNSILKKYDAIFIGRHTADKGFFGLLEIWNILVNKYKKKYSLVTIGNVPVYFQPQIKERIKKYGIEKYVNMLGEVSESEKLKCLTQSKMLVFPSKQEGWGIVPMEALSLGLPVVVYDLDVYKESIGETEVLRTVRVGDIDGFAKEIIKARENVEEFSKLAKLWRSKFDWESVAKKEWQIIYQI